MLFSILNFESVKSGGLFWSCTGFNQSPTGLTWAFNGVSINPRTYFDAVQLKIMPVRLDSNRNLEPIVLHCNPTIGI